MLMSSSLIAFFGLPGGMEMVALLIIVLLLFGSQKIPSLMRNLGKSANEFKRGMAETEDEDENKSEKS
jgi:sec-independent protein translocase protein TatA